MPPVSSMTSTGGTSAPSSRGALVCLLTAVVSLIFASLLNVDAPGLGGLAALDADMQHAIAVFRAHRTGIDIVGQRDDAPEAAAEAFVDVRRGLGLGRRQLARTFAGHGQDALFDLHVDAGRVNTGCEGIDLDRLRCRTDVQGRKAATGKAADAGRDVEVLPHFVLQAFQLGEEVAGKQGTIDHEVFSFRTERAPGSALDPDIGPIAKSSRA